MYGLYHGDPGSRVLTILVGYAVSNRGVGGHTSMGSFEFYNVFPGFIMWPIYCYNILNMTRMLILGSMHSFAFEFLYGGQK